MFNFLKKKSRVFLIFLALLLSFSSILNLSAPAFADDPPVSTSSTEEVNKTAEKLCKKKVGVLGWILCPLTLGAAEAISGLYQDIQDKYMNIRPALFDQTLYQQWAKCRDWANIVFIVLFFIVILSQLTGIGIDNYGIKRILPRIVVGAILINLSYIICQLAIDVSNIVGTGVIGFLNTAGGGNGPKSGYIPIALTSPTSGGTGASAGGEIRISLNGINAGLLIIILLCLVVALLSVVILWVFCLVRDIGIVVATCLSPLAFAANLLPNTEGFYKKWLSLSKILLTIFPICALTVSAGLLVSHVLSALDGESWLMQLAAVLAATLPFVAIPYLLLNALSAFGTIGSKISNWGRGKLNAGWAGTGRAVGGITGNTARVAGRGALRVGGAVARVPLGVGKDALKKVKSTNTGQKIAGAYDKVKGAPGTLTKKVSDAYSGSKFGQSETGKAVAKLATAPVNAVKDTAKEAVEATKYAVKKPLSDMRSKDVKRAQERAEVNKWTGAYTQAAIEKAKMDVAGSAASLTGIYGNAERRAALQRSEESNRRNAEANVDMLTPQYIEHKDRHYDTIRQNEAIKMNMEQFASQDKGAVETELRSILTALQTMSTDHPERAENENRAYAAMRDLASKGATEELLKTAYDHSDMITSDPRMIQELAGVSPIFKEFAKNQALPSTDTNRAASFADFVDNGKLAEALFQNGGAAYGAFDKDNWKFAAAYPGVIQTVAKGGAGPLAISLVNAQDGKTVQAQVNYVNNNLSADDKKAVIQQISPEQFVKLSNDMRAALAGVAPDASESAKALAIGTAFSSQLEQIEQDQRLRGRMSQSDQIYIDHRQGPVPPPTPTP